MQVASMTMTSPGSVSGAAGEQAQLATNFASTERA